MQRRTLSRIGMAASAVLALGLSGITSNASSSDGSGGAVPTFQQYHAAAFKDADGQYIVNGDEAMSSTGALRDYYQRMVGSRDGDTAGLVVNTVGGADDRWSAAQVGNLTYCVSSKFGADHAAVANAMAQGAALWENASSAVDFVYVSSANSSCTTRNNAVLFSVEPTKTTQYIARAFFPSTGDRSRNVLVNATSLQNSGSWTPGNIMGHELGHTLGFRHEHTRPEAGTCFEDNNWRPLTPYDSASIMHYPQCNGTSDDLSFTSSDGAGVRALYGS